MLGVFGEVYLGILDELDVLGLIVGFEVFLDSVLELCVKVMKIKFVVDFLDFLLLECDFVFVVDRKISVVDVLFVV